MFSLLLSPFKITRQTAHEFYIFKEFTLLLSNSTGALLITPYVTRNTGNGILSVLTLDCYRLFNNNILYLDE